MADLNAEQRNFMVCVGLILDSVPKLLRTLVNQRCRPDLKTYISNNPEKIKGKRRWLPAQKIILMQTENPNIDEWDTSLLFWFLTEVAAVDPDEKEQLNKLRAIRNELVRCTSTHLVKHKYEIIISDIKSAFKYFEKLTDIEFELDAKLKQFIIPSTEQTSDQKKLADMSERLMNWYHDDKPVGKATIITSADDSEQNIGKVHGEHVHEEEITKTSPTAEMVFKRMLPAYLNVKGIASKVSVALIQWLQSAAEEEYMDADFVWIGYDITMYEDKIPTIVAMYKDIPKGFQNRFLSLEVIQKQIGDVSPEARHVADYERENKLQFSSEEIRDLQKCLNSNTEHLMNDHSNLLIISTSKVKSIRYGLPQASLKHKACVVLYVHVKGIIPLGEEPFPLELGGVPVDVRESIFEEYGRPDDYLEELMMGCKIATEYQTSGTLGGFVELKSGKVGCLTCCHVFKTATNKDCFPSKKDVKMDKLKKEVYQPADQFDAFGEVIQFVDCKLYDNAIGVDAALIEITDIKRRPTSGRFPNADSPFCGFSADKPMVFNSGDIIHNWDEIPNYCRIVKYGAETEHTIGYLNPINVAVRGFRFKGKLPFTTRPKQLLKQIDIRSLDSQPFAEPGDSGSLVFAVTGEPNNYEVRALGLLVGGTKHGSAAITPIWAVLGLLKRHIKSPLSLYCFNGEAPIPPSATSRVADLVEDTDETTETRLANLKDQLKKITNAFNERFTMIESNVDSIHTKLDVHQASINSKFEELMTCFLSAGAKNAEIARENNNESENVQDSSRNANQ